MNQNDQIKQHVFVCVNDINVRLLPREIKP